MLIEHLRRQLHDRDARSLRRQRRVAESPCSAIRFVRGDAAGECSVLGFCSNDYLGLANHPAVTGALAAGARRWGAGSGASHLVSGHTGAHAALEEAVANSLSPWIPHAKALTFCTGYLANVAILTALGDTSATIFADKLNHASLLDGALLSKAQVKRYPHARVDLLAGQLASCETPIKLIVTDAVFSMDGDLADMPALLALAERFDAWLVIDDAHGFGVLGVQGQGSLAHFGLTSERIIYMATLGKAVGVAGAVVVAHPTVIDWLIQTARTYVYTTASPPAMAHAALASLQVLRGNEGDERRATLAALIDQFRSLAGELIAAHPGCGWSLADSSTAIQPLIVGANEPVLRLSAALDAQGLWVPAIRPPTVPAGTARLRITLSATHERRDVQRLTDALAQAIRTP